MKTETDLQQNKREDSLESDALHNPIEDERLLLVKQHSNLRVASYNILTSRSYPYKENDPREQQQLSWEFRKKLILDMTEKLDLDILALQEVRSEQLSFLKEHLTNFGMIGFSELKGYTLSNIPEGEYVGEIVPILYNNETIRCLDSKVFWLSPNPTEESTGWDASRPRILTCGVFLNKLDGKTIVVGNTHYDHLGDHALINSGIVEAELLERYKIEHGASDIIYMGDRNCFTDDGRSGNKWYKIFKEKSGAKDTRFCGNHVGLGTTFFGYHPDNFKAPYDANSGRFKSNTLDLIFHKGDNYKVKLSMCSAVEYAVQQNGNTFLLPLFGNVKAAGKRQFASDHGCVVADLEKVVSTGVIREPELAIREEPPLTFMRTRHSEIFNQKWVNDHKNQNQLANRMKYEYGPGIIDTP